MGVVWSPFLRVLSGGQRIFSGYLFNVIRLVLFSSDWFDSTYDPSALVSLRSASSTTAGTARNCACPGFPNFLFCTLKTQVRRGRFLANLWGTRVWTDPGTDPVPEFSRSSAPDRSTPSTMRDDWRDGLRPCRTWASGIPLRLNLHFEQTKKSLGNSTVAPTHVCFWFPNFQFFSISQNLRFGRFDFQQTHGTQGFGPTLSPSLSVPVVQVSGSIAPSQPVLGTTWDPIRDLAIPCRP